MAIIKKIETHAEGCIRRLANIYLEKRWINRTAKLIDQYPSKEDFERAREANDQLRNKPQGHGGSW